MNELPQLLGEEKPDKGLSAEQDMTLQSSGRIKDEMISHLAHEWRQPLNIISLMIMDLQESWECGEVDAAFMKQSTEIIMEQVQRMSKIIDDSKNGLQQTTSSPC